MQSSTDYEKCDPSIYFNYLESLERKKEARKFERLPFINNPCDIPKGCPYITIDGNALFCDFQFFEATSQTPLKTLLNFNSKITSIQISPFLNPNDLSSDENLVGLIAHYLFKNLMKESFQSENMPIRSPFKVYPKLLSNPSGLRHVILTALFCLHVLIRPPFFSESNEIEENLYHGEPEDTFLPLLQNHGWKTFQHDERCMVLSGGKAGKELWGAIHYENQENSQECHIISLRIKKGLKGRGYGTLLMAYALLEGKEWGCRKAVLISSRKGASFYIKSGFIPVNISIEQWKNLSFEEKIKRSFSGYPLSLDLTNQENIELLHSHIFKVLNT